MAWSLQTTPRKHYINVSPGNRSPRSMFVVSSFPVSTAYSPDPSGSPTRTMAKDSVDTGTTYSMKCVLLSVLLSTIFMKYSLYITGFPDVKIALLNCLYCNLHVGKSLQGYRKYLGTHVLGVGPVPRSRRDRFMFVCGLGSNPLDHT